MEGFEGAGGGVVNFDFGQSVGDFLAVGADVLNGSCAGEAGDFAEGFDAGKAALAGIRDDVVPIFAAHDFDLLTFGGDAAHAVD